MAFLYYHAVYVPADGDLPPVSRIEETLKELADWLRVNCDLATGHVYGFKGARLPLTSGPGSRCILDVDLESGLTTSSEPLFDQVEPGPPSFEANLEELARLDPGYAELTASLVDDDSDDEDHGHQTASLS